MKKQTCCIARGKSRREAERKYSMSKLSKFELNFVNSTVADRIFKVVE